MKKVLVLALVLAVATMVSAGTVSFQASNTNVLVGEVVSITVIATGNCTNIAIPQILSDNAGLASNRALAAGFNQFPQVGTIVNAGNVLITGISGATPFAFPPVPVLAGTSLYTFDYTVPEVGAGTVITISGAGSLSFMFDDFSQTTGMGSTSMTVVPEPMTIALLGLGGLFIRRRK